MAASLLASDGPAQEGAATALTPVERFKQFLSSLPAIKDLVFQRKVPMGGGMLPLDGSFALSTSFEYFHAKWQTNGLLFRRLSRPEDATNFTVAGALVSWSGHQHALLEPKDRFTTWDDRDPTTLGKKTSVFYTSEFFLDPLRHILNLGIMYADIGSVRWQGNQFQTECDVDHEHVRITGELVPAGDAPPRCLRVQYAFPDKSYHYIVRYGYAPLLYPYLPSSITNFWLADPAGRNKKEIELDEWKILSLETTNGPLAAEAFDSTPFARVADWSAHVYTNGGIYERGTNGTLRLTYTLSSQPDHARRPPSRAALAAFYTGWGAANLAIFALMLGAKEEKNKPIERETNV